MPVLAGWGEAEDSGEMRERVGGGDRGRIWSGEGRDGFPRGAGYGICGEVVVACCLGAGWGPQPASRGGCAGGLALARRVCPRAVETRGTGRGARDVVDHRRGRGA